MTTGAPTIAPLQSLKRQPEYSTTVTTNNLVRIFHRNSHPCFHKTSQSQRPAKFNRAHTRAQLSVQSTVNLAIRLALLLPALVLLPGCIVLFPLPIVVTLEPRKYPRSPELSGTILDEHEHSRVEGAKIYFTRHPGVSCKSEASGEFHLKVTHHWYPFTVAGPAGVREPNYQVWNPDISVSRKDYTPRRIEHYYTNVVLLRKLSDSLAQALTDVAAAAQKALSGAVSTNDIAKALEKGCWNSNFTAIAISINKAPEPSLIFVFLKQANGQYLAVNVSAVEDGNLGRLGTPERAAYEHVETILVGWAKRDDGNFEISMWTMAYKAGRRHRIPERLLIRADGTPLYRPRRPSAADH